MVILFPTSDWFTILYKSYATSHLFVWSVCVLNDSVSKRCPRGVVFLVPALYTTIQAIMNLEMEWATNVWLQSILC